MTSDAVCFVNSRSKDMKERQLSCWITFDSTMDESHRITVQYQSDSI